MLYKLRHFIFLFLKWINRHQSNLTWYANCTWFLRFTLMSDSFSQITIEVACVYYVRLLATTFDCPIVLRHQSMSNVCRCILFVYCRTTGIFGDPDGQWVGLPNWDAQNLYRKVWRDVWRRMHRKEIHAISPCLVRPQNRTKPKQPPGTGIPEIIAYSFYSNFPSQSPVKIK